MMRYDKRFTIISKYLSLTDDFIFNILDNYAIDVDLILKYYIDIEDKIPHKILCKILEKNSLSVVYRGYYSKRPDEDIDDELMSISLKFDYKAIFYYSFNRPNYNMNLEAFCNEFHFYFDMENILIGINLLDQYCSMRSIEFPVQYLKNIRICDVKEYKHYNTKIDNYKKLYSHHFLLSVLNPDRDLPNTIDINDHPNISIAECNNTCFLTKKILEKNVPNYQPTILRNFMYMFFQKLGMQKCLKIKSLCAGNARNNAIIYIIDSLISTCKTLHEKRLANSANEENSNNEENPVE